MSERPTLKTIARLSGLAIATVSRALGDAPDISAATKARVSRIAREIGYVPDRAGVRLRTGRTHVISLVLAADPEMMDLTARLIAAIAAGLRETRYHLTITPFYPDEDRMRPVRYVVETAAADALILNQIEPDDPRVAYLIDRGFPFATHGRSRRSAEHAYFDFDNEAFARLGVERLLARGRRRILLIAPPRAQSYADDLIRGATLATGSAGAELVVLDGVSSDSGIAAIRSAVAARLDGRPSVDGLLVGAPLAAMAAVAGFEARGLAVGRDFDVVAKDAVPFLSLFREPIMTIEEDVSRAGDFLARAAVHAIEHPDAPPMQCLDQPV